MKLHLFGEHRKKREITLQARAHDLEIPPHVLGDDTIVTVACRTHLDPDVIRLDCETRVTATLDCDRCLDEVTREFTGAFTVVARQLRLGETIPGDTGEDVGEDGASMKYIPYGDDSIDITADVRDAVLLALPVKVLCGEECRGLCSGCGANLNREPCTCTRRAVDDRWRGLEKYRDSAGPEKES